MADDQADRVSVPTLVMTGGPLDGTAYPLQFTGREIIVGSSLDADVQILLGNVESFHSRISFENGALLLSDAGSATGTFVNGEKIENAHPLQEGDRICLGPPGAKGSAKLVVRMPGSTQSPLLLGSDGPPDLGEQETGPGSEDANLFLGSEEESGLPPASRLPEDDDALATDRESPGSIVEDDGSDAGDVVGLAPSEEQDDELFVSPLAGSQPSAAGGGATPQAPTLASLDDEIPLPALSGEHAGMPAPAPPPPASAQTLAPPAPPPPPASAQRLTAPPPPPPAAPRPDYMSDLPSIPLAKSDEPAPEPFPPLRPARPAARPAAKPAAVRKRPARRRGFSMPSLPLPVVGGALALVLVAGLVWLLLPRSKPPELVSITPSRVDAGQTVTLSGTHFAKAPGDNTVLFGSLPGKVSAASATELKVVVPQQARAELAVTVETKAGRSAPVRLNVLPVATASAVDPDVAMPGQSVVIHGDGFSAQNVAVRFAGLPAASIEDIAGGLKVVVPEITLPEGSATTVTVESGGQPARSFPFILGRLPLVLEASPSKGTLGEKITLKGRGFAPQARANAVTIGGEPTLVLSASATSLTVIAPAPPAGELSPEFPIVVRVGTRSSSGRTSFAYERGSTSGFPLRFFPAPVTEYPAEDLAFVSTELGPTLLLGGPSGAGTTSERATELAAALNAAVDSETRQRVVFELRERPEPAVALVGAPRPLLVATQADVNAYAKPWAGAAARRVTPAVLARHWLALLQDYFGLFLRRERPLRVLTTSPYGQVLGEIYSEAGRRAPGGPNVPASIVLPTPSAMASALRQLALVVAAEGGRSAVALEGTWQGTIQDVDRGERSFRVVVRQEKGRLAGELTTGQGGIEIGSPLRDIAFEHGNVRFTANLDGAPHQFQGKLVDVTVTGTITRPKRDPASFTMQYAQ